MPLFKTRAEHDANPPESWRITETSSGRWHLTDGTGRVLFSADTEQECQTYRADGFYTRLYRTEWASL